MLPLPDVSVRILGSKNQFKHTVYFKRILGGALFNQIVARVREPDLGLSSQKQCPKSHCTMIPMRMPVPSRDRLTDATACPSDTSSG